MNVCICGGGSLAHALAAVIGARDGVRLSILTRQPQRWSPTVRGLYLDIAEVVGRIAVIDDNPEIVCEASVVLLALPSTAIEEVLTRIRPFLRPDTLVGALPGFPGFDWRARNILDPHVTVFGSQRVPYVRRTISYGEAVWISGIRPRLFVASLPSQQARLCAQTLEFLTGIPTETLATFLLVNLSTSNPTFHTARLYASLSRLAMDPDIGRPAQFYEEWDDGASEVFLALDAELASIGKALDISGLVPILNHYGAHDPSSLTERIRSIRALRDRTLPVARSPQGWVPDTDSSYFQEDIGEGLLAIRGIAEVAGVATPAMDKILAWAGGLMEESFVGAEGRCVLHEAKPIPRRFGLGAADILKAAAQ
jgi:hypothetical protein